MKPFKVGPIGKEWVTRSMSFIRALGMSFFPFSFSLPTCHEVSSVLSQALPLCSNIWSGLEAVGKKDYAVNPKTLSWKSAFSLRADWLDKIPLNLVQREDWTLPTYISTKESLTVSSVFNGNIWEMTNGTAQRQKNSLGKFILMYLWLEPSVWKYLQ